MSSSLLIRGGVVVTMNDGFDIVSGDVSIRDGRIVAIGPNLAGATSAYDTVKVMTPRAAGCFRLRPDARASLSDVVPWIRRRSAADGLAADARVADGSGSQAGHSPRRARLGITELLASGTTTVLTMETVHDTDVGSKKRPRAAFGRRSASA